MSNIYKTVLQGKNVNGIPRFKRIRSMASNSLILLLEKKDCILCAVKYCCYSMQSFLCREKPIIWSIKNCYNTIWIPSLVRHPRKEFILFLKAVHAC